MIFIVIEDLPFALRLVFFFRCLSVGGSESCTTCCLTAKYQEISKA